MIKSSRRDGPWSEMPPEVVRAAHRPICTICGRAYGRISVGAAGAFLKVEEAIHHIFARRWLEKQDLYPHDPENLVSICKSDHAKLLQSEECLWRGDVLGFIQGMNAAGLPLELITVAARHYELMEVLKVFDCSAVAVVKERGRKDGREEGDYKGGEEREGKRGKTVDNEKPVEILKMLSNPLIIQMMGQENFHRTIHSRLVLNGILEEIASQHGSPVAELRSSKKWPALVSARRHFSKVAREAGFSFPAIGRALDRHHTTIIHLVKAEK